MNNIKLLTLDDLDSKHNRQLNYFKTKLPTSSTPESLFLPNGEFNDSNWNSGEAIYIRNFIRDVDYDYDSKVIREFDVSYWKYDIHVGGEVFVNHLYYDNHTYLTILVDGYYNEEIDDDCHTTYFTDQYVVRIYKSRGGIELFYKNGQPITRNEYLSLLHILQGAKLIKEEK